MVLPTCSTDMFCQIMSDCRIETKCLAQPVQEQFVIAVLNLLMAALAFGKDISALAYR